MNNNRMKYASTPTYGMQKRSFAKKQAAAQTNPTPDFTQQPAMDAEASGAPFATPSAFMMPPNVFPGGATPQNAPVYFNGASAPQMMPNAAQPPFPMNATPTGYPNFMAPPQTQSVPMFQQRPAGAGSVPDASYAPRTQGYIPPNYGLGGGALPPNVLRGDAMAGMQGMNAMPVDPRVNPNGMGSMNPNNPMGGMGGMNTMGGNNMYGGMGYPQGGMMNGGAPAYGNGGYPPNRMGAPMNMNGYNQPPFQGMEGGGMPAMPTPRPPFDADKLLKILLYGVLPVLFIPCIFVSHTFDFLRYFFIIASVITLSIIWYRQSFSSTVRTTLSIGYLVMCIITIAMLISGNKDVTQTAGALNANGAAQVTAEPTASVEAAPLAAQETPAPEEDLGESEAEQRLTTFMDYWAVNKIEEMVNLVQPSWASTQDSPAQVLFTLISNRTPMEYQIESISGTASDSSRTVTMSAYIDKNNGKDPVRYRFMILMVKEAGEWYVDPNSLATNDTVEATTVPASGVETIAQSLAPRMTVTPIPDPSTKLYYNASGGGKYYHIDPNCSAVNPKYLPLASFLYSELDDPPYNSLQPCLKCGAPTPSLKALEAAATSTPAP